YRPAAFQQGDKYKDCRFPTDGFGFKECFFGVKSGFLCDFAMLLHPLELPEPSPATSRQFVCPHQTGADPLADNGSAEHVKRVMDADVDPGEANDYRHGEPPPRP